MVLQPAFHAERRLTDEKCADLALSLDHCAGGAPQPVDRSVRSSFAGYLASAAPVRVGRGENVPPQFGQRPPSTVSAHARQKVHSNEQIIASVASGGRSRSQHSQLGRS